MPRGGACRLHDDETGFSLLALLAVLITLGAIAAIAVAAVNSEPSSSPSTAGVGVTDLESPSSNTSLADQAACKASAAAIESAALAYFASHDATWPVDIAALTDSTPPYLRNAPNPKWGLVYDATTGHVDATPCDKL